MTDTAHAAPATHHHAFNFHTGRPRFHFDEASDAAAAAAAASSAKPWHDGIDAEIIGHAQNKGWKLDDPKEAFTFAAKQAREAEKFVGADPKFIVKLPKDVSDEAGWNSVYQRLGMPADPKEYDFSAVKRADGNAPDAGLLDTIRATAASLRLPKDKAPDLAAAVVKHLDNVSTEQAAAKATALATEKADLAKSWGPKADLNRVTASLGAKRLGVDPETVALLESQLGYSKVMEMFRKVGDGTDEDTFVEGYKTNVVTRESAQARLKELTNDKAWGKRLLDGDAAAKREFDSLTAMVAA